MILDCEQGHFARGNIGVVGRDHADVLINELLFADNGVDNVPLGSNKAFPKLNSLKTICCVQGI